MMKGRTLLFNTNIGFIVKKTSSSKKIGIINKIFISLYICDKIKQFFR